MALARQSGFFGTEDKTRLKIHACSQKLHLDTAPTMSEEEYERWERNRDILCMNFSNEDLRRKLEKVLIPGTVIVQPMGTMTVVHNDAVIGSTTAAKVYSSRAIQTVATQQLDAAEMIKVCDHQAQADGSCFYAELSGTYVEDPTTGHVAFCFEKQFGASVWHNLTRANRDDHGVVLLKLIQTVERVIRQMETHRGYCPWFFNLWDMWEWFDPKTGNLAPDYQIVGHTLLTFDEEDIATIPTNPNGFDMWDLIGERSIHRDKCRGALCYMIVRMFILYSCGPVAVKAYIRACKTSKAGLPIGQFLVREGYKTWMGERFVR